MGERGQHAPLEPPNLRRKHTALVLQNIRDSWKLGRHDNLLNEESSSSVDREVKQYNSPVLPNTSRTFMNEWDLGEGTGYFDFFHEH